MRGRCGRISPLIRIILAGVLLGVLSAGSEMALSYADKMSAFEVIANFLLKYTPVLYSFTQFSSIFLLAFWLPFFHIFHWEFLIYKKEENLFRCPIG